MKMIVMVVSVVMVTVMMVMVVNVVMVTVVMVMSDDGDHDDCNGDDISDDGGH